MQYRALDFFIWIGNWGNRVNGLHFSRLVNRNDNVHRIFPLRENFSYPLNALNAFKCVAEIRNLFLIDCVSHECNMITIENLGNERCNVNNPKCVERLMSNTFYQMAASVKEFTYLL